MAISFGSLIAGLRRDIKVGANVVQDKLHSMLSLCVKSSIKQVIHVFLNNCRHVLKMQKNIQDSKGQFRILNKVMYLKISKNHHSKSFRDDI